MIASSPMLADAMATVDHQLYSLNTAHAVTVKPATVSKARTLTAVQAAPVGGGVLPAKVGVIHRNVLPNRNSPIATTFLKLHIVALLTGARFHIDPFVPANP